MMKAISAKEFFKTVPAKCGTGSKRGSGKKSTSGKRTEKLPPRPKLRHPVSAKEFFSTKKGFDDE